MDKDNNQPKNEDVVAEDDSLLVEDQPTNPSYNEALADSAQVNRSEDEVLQSAANNLSEEEAASRPQTPKKKSKKPLVILLVLILLAGACYGAWYIYQQQQTEPVANNQEAASAPTEAEPTYEANTLAYVFRESEDLPYSLFWRPVSGGERSQSLKLNRNTTITTSDIHGANVAFATEDSIYVSADSGETYEEIIELKPGERVTSIKFNVAGDRLGVALLPDSSEANKVVSYELDGNNPTDIFTADKASVVINGWGDKRVFFSEGCIDCDGQKTPNSYDVATKEFEEIKFSDAEIGINTITVSDDLSKVIILNSQEAENTIGTAPPYQIEILDVASGEKTLLSTIGEENEKNPNGTLKTYVIETGFLTGTNTPYYTDENELYVVKDSTPSKAFESEKEIQYVEYVSDDNIIVGTGDSLTNYTLVNFSTSSQESTTLISADENTTLLGITTK
jgi:hypothetical protein